MANKKADIRNWVIVWENKHTFEKGVFCEVKIKLGEIRPLTSTLKQHHDPNQLFNYAYFEKKYYNDNKETINNYPL